MQMKQVSEFIAHDGWVTALAFGSDGTLFSGGWDHLAKRWDPITGTLLNTYDGHDQVVYSVLGSPDGCVLLTASVDKTARVWDVDTAIPLHILTGHRKTVSALAISPDGKIAFTGSY